MNEIPQKTAEPKKSTYKSSKVPYSRGDIKNWISFGINNGYVNKFKKDEIAKWTELMLKHGVIKMEEINKNF
jgi:hypothetical protein